MAIEKITTAQLRTMKDKEGLVIQGCGGDLQEWVDGLNESLNESGILKNGSRFENGYSFRHDNSTCLFFPFGEVDCDIENMAVWRIKTHELFCGTWFQDYVHNRLGGFADEAERKRPMCPIIGADGNIFNLLGIASKTLKDNGMAEEAKEMYSRVTSSDNYNKALCIIAEYVDPCREKDMQEETEETEGLSRQQ